MLGARRAYQAAEQHTLAGLLRLSRERQADVTGELAAQVFEAVEILLHGFELASARQAEPTADGALPRARWLQHTLNAPDDHLYQGVLSVVLRLVFLLYAEDQSLLPVGHPFYAKHLSVKALYDELVEDAGQHPESMHHRRGAYGRLLSLFRAVYLGVQHQDLVMPPRRGRLFDPSSFPFLEGGLPGSTAAIASAEDRAATEPPAVDDGVIHAVLTRLILLQGQRLSYRALDVEQIGSVYESLMGYHVLALTSPAARLGKRRVWMETGWLREQTAAERRKWLKEIVGLSAAQVKKVEEAQAEHESDDAFADALKPLAPGKRAEQHRHVASVGQLVLQPGEERRRSGSHYTPRSLTERIVHRTLEPVLACLGDTPTEAQLLELKICDPAMGSGAFLVEACRHLADHLVAIWSREGRIAAIEERVGDAHLHARRLVAQRCLYGVDKNAAAVDLAKLSLWLITLSERLPFTFVDHALRHGDALVGLNLQQIRAFHWKPGKQSELSEGLLDDALDQAIDEREAILALADQEGLQSQEDKRRRLVHADRALERIRLIADVCVGVFFAAGKDRAREDERKRCWALVEAALAGDEAAERELHVLAARSRRQHAPFHWWLEFPEVFQLARHDPLNDSAGTAAASMDAVVGNPPFAGKNGILNTSGPYYLHWLQATHPGAHGNADLSAHFFRRADTLLAEHGNLGLIATNTIAQGDTRATGLKHLVTSGAAIYNATNSMPWPGTAAVTVSVVHLARGNPIQHAALQLDGKSVEAISSRLRPRPERNDAVALAANAGCAFQGSIVLGMGFVLTPEEREALVQKNPMNAERIFPYLGGEEVNTSPTQDFHRYVISFGQMTLEEAGAWPDLLAIVREKVKPERDKNNREQYRKYWWRFGEPRPALAAALVPLDRCLVTASKGATHLMFSFQPTDRIFTQNLYVLMFDNSTAYAVLQSQLHKAWVALLSASLKTDLSYTASDCFDTFPFPQPDPRTDLPEVEAAGQTLFNTRAAYLLETQQGLTRIYNALKDPDNTDEAILHLRALHETMDRAVLDAYGWQDIAVPPFCPITESDKAALTAFEDEVIDRLYLLNEARAREEQRLGLSKKKASGKKKVASKRAARAATTPNNPGAQGALFADGANDDD